MEFFIDILESNIGYWLFIVSSVFLILFGLIMYLGIKNNGRVIFLSYLLKNKDFDNEVLLSRYTIQSIYTSVFGIIILSLTLFNTLSMLNIFYIILIVAVFDGTFDYFAIKKSK